MRLCYLADPTSSHTVKWLVYFVRQGHEVHLMGWAAPTDPALTGAYYHHLPSELHPPFTGLGRSALWHLGLWRFAHRRQMQTILAEIKPDIFDILMLNADQIPAALAWRGPLVVTPWGDDLLIFPNHYSPITKFLLRLVLRRANLVLCNSDLLAQAANTLGAPLQRIRRVGQIVDLTRFHPGLDGSATRAHFGLTGWPILLSPRQLLPNYRIDILIRALAEVLPVYPDAQLILLGKRDLDPKYAASLDDQIEQMGLQRHVIFGGWLANDDMPSVYALADVVVSMPISDSRPASVFEAMACGVPVAVSDLEALREIVQDEETGLVVPIDDEKSLAQVVIRLLRDNSLRRRITDQALEFVRNVGDYEAQMAVVAGYYAELLRN